MLASFTYDTFNNTIPDCRDGQITSWCLIFPLVKYKCTVHVFLPIYQTQCHGNHSEVSSYLFIHVCLPLYTCWVFWLPFENIWYCLYTTNEYAFVYLLCCNIFYSFLPFSLLTEAEHDSQPDCPLT